MRRVSIWAALVAPVVIAVIAFAGGAFGAGSSDAPHASPSRAVHRHAVKRVAHLSRAAVPTDPAVAFRAPATASDQLPQAAIDGITTVAGTSPTAARRVVSSGDWTLYAAKAGAQYCVVLAKASDGSGSINCNDADGLKQGFVAVSYDNVVAGLTPDNAASVAAPGPAPTPSAGRSTIQAAPEASTQQASVSNGAYLIQGASLRGLAVRDASGATIATHP
jgi:hypothetical protein